MRSATHLLTIALAVVLFTSTALAQQGGAIVHLTVKPERTNNGNRLLVRWETTVPASTGNIDVSATFQNSSGPIKPSFPADPPTVIRQNPSDPLSAAIGCRFTAAIPLKPPLTLDGLTDLHIDAVATLPATATTTAAQLRGGIDLDLDALRDYYATQERLSGITKERDTYKIIATKHQPASKTSMPRITLVDATPWTTALILRLQSDQTVEATVELYHLENNTRAGTSGDASATRLLTANQPLPIPLTNLPPNKTFEAQITLHDARTSIELSRSSERVTLQGDPIHTLPGNTPLPEAKLTKNPLNVNVVNHTLELPLKVTNAKRIVAVIETKDQFQNWNAQDPVVRDLTPPAGNNPMQTTVTIPANLAVGDNYRVHVRAQSPVDDNTITVAQDTANFRVPPPIASKVQIKFTKDSLMVTAPTQDDATIGINFTGQTAQTPATATPATNPNQLTTSQSSKSPTVAIPLSTLTSIPAGTPFEFTVLVKASDDTGRDYQQTVSLSVDQTELQAKTAQEKTAVKNFSTALTTGNNARLDSRTLAKTGLAAFLQVILKGVLPVL